MFNNLIESDTHRNDLKRRGSFFLVTTAAYALFFVFAGVLSIYAYDAQLENQNQELILLGFVPQVEAPPESVRPRANSSRSAANNSGPRKPTILPVLYEDSSNPRTPPKGISTMAATIPPAKGNYTLGDRYVPGSDGPSIGPIGTGDGPGRNGRLMPDLGEPPPLKAKEPPAKPRTVRKTVLNSEALSLPAPPYPRIAKQLGVQGTVSVQVLLDETGKVISARAVSGHPTLSPAAQAAAYQARFTPTLLDGQAVKVSGVITYIFRLER